MVLFKIGQVVTFAPSYIILGFHTHFGCRTLDRKFTEVMLVSPRGLTTVVTWSELIVGFSLQHDSNKSKIGEETGRGGDLCGDLSAGESATIPTAETRVPTCLASSTSSSRAIWHARTRYANRNTITETSWQWAGIDHTNETVCRGWQLWIPGPNSYQREMGCQLFSEKWWMVVLWEYWPKDCLGVDGHT